MLSREENDLLGHVGPEAPMGQMLQRYWLPFLPAADLQADGAPRRVRLLGQDLVAFRDSIGRVGLLDEYCPHRGASLVLARNEQCALTCIYHGWKIAADGTVVDTPAEPEDSDFRSRVKAISYPVQEAGGLVWAYLGPPGSAPPFPSFAWMAYPDSHRLVTKMQSDCNWTQAVEGVIDSAHSNYLHSDMIIPSATDASSNGQTRWVPTQGIDYMRRPSNDGRPRLEAQNTDYGFRYAAIRKPLIEPEKYKYVRTTLFIAPCSAMVPPPEGWITFQAFVPMDDEHTMMLFVQTDTRGPIADPDTMRRLNGTRPGVDIDDDGRKRATRANNFLQDRQAMQERRSYSGIQGVLVQDMAVQESMGSLYDRRKEHLGASDLAVIRFRRLMLDAVRRFQGGGAPLGLERPVAYDRLRAEERMVPLETPWQVVGAFAGEPTSPEDERRVVAS